MGPLSIFSGGRIFAMMSPTRSVTAEFHRTFGNQPGSIRIPERPEPRTALAAASGARRFWGTPEPDQTRWLPMHFVSILFRSFRRFLEDDCMVLASAIAFGFLLSLIPFLTLSIMVTKAIQHALQVKGFLPSDAIRILTDDLIRIVPFVSKKWVGSILIHPQAARSFRIFTLLMLPVVSGLIFHELEIAYSKIFRKSPRPLLLRQVIYSCVSILAIPVLFIANTIWTFASSILPRVFDFLRASGLAEHVSIAFPEIPLIGIDLVSVATLLLFYVVTVRMFLKQGVARLHILLSGLVFVLLWVMAKQLFAFYLSSIASLDILYGSLSSLIILLIWIFYSAAALLFAVEVMYTLSTDAKTSS